MIDDLKSRIKDLQEKRARAWEASKEALDAANVETEGVRHGLVGEVRTKWEAADSDVDSLTREIDALNKELAVERADAQVIEEREDKTGESNERYVEVFDKFMRQGVSALEREERKLLMENRAQSVGTDSAGGFTVPEGFWNRVSETMLAFGGIQGNVNAITTDSGNDLPWPTNDDTTNEGAILAENAQIGEQDLVFGERTLGAYMYTSKLVRVSYQLLQDSAIDIEGFLARKLGMRLARIQNRHFTVGTGSGQPDGIAVGATVGKTAASATAVTHDELLDLVHSIDPAYRGNGSKFMLADLSVAAIRKITDGDGNKVWQPGLVADVPDRILGYNYVVNQNMPAMTTGNVSMLFGDFREGYVTRNVRGLQVRRLDERYADYLQVGWFGFLRADGTKDDTNAYKSLVMA